MVVAGDYGGGGGGGGGSGNIGDSCNGYVDIVT